MSEQSMRLRVGAFVLTTLVLLGALILFFSSFPVLFQRHHEYTIVFSEAPGVGPGTPVRRSGVPIGEVRTVQLDDATGKVHVAVLVAVPHTLREGDEPVLVHGIIGGDTAIDFVAPQGAEAERPALPPGAQIPGQSSPDANRLLRQTSELVPSTQETLNDMRRSMQRFERMAPTMEDAFREVRDLSKAAREALPEFRQTNQELQVTARNWGRLGERLDVLVQTNEDKFVKTLDNVNDTVTRIGRVFNDENQRRVSSALQNGDEMIKEGRQTLRRLDASITRSDEVLGNLQQATKPMAERGDRVMRNLDESTQKLNRTMTEAEDLTRTLNRGDGLLRRMATDPTLYNHLNELTCMFLRLMPRMDRILRDMEVFADKVARHPESLGLGGVVAPSAGLKEAPTANGHFWQRP